MSRFDETCERDRYRAVLDSLNEGFCIQEILFDGDGRPDDYRFVEVNPAFERHTGLKNAAGRTIRELAPDIDQGWIETYANIVRTQTPQRFESSALAMGRHFEVYAFPVGAPQEHLVGVTFRDVSWRHRREMNAAFIAELAEDLAEATTEAEIVEVVAGSVRRYLGTAFGMLIDISESFDSFAMHYLWGGGDGYVTRVLPFEGVISPDVAAASSSGKTLVVRNAATDRRINGDAVEQLGIRSGIIVPARRGGRYSTGFGVAHGEPRDWRQDEIHLVEDIAHRVITRIERARHEAVLAFQAEILRSVHDAIVATDASHAITYWSDKAHDLFGWTAEEVLGRTLMEVLQSTVPGSCWEVETERMLASNEYAGEIVCRHKDGRDIHVDVSVAVCRDKDGQVREYVASHRDITRRKQAEEELVVSRAALEESELRARQLIEYAPTGIYEIGFQPPRFLWVNDAMCVMCGYGREELLDMDPFELLDEGSAALFQARMRQMAEGEEPDSDVQYTVRCKDGSEIKLVLQVRFNFDAEGKPDGAFVIGHDVTERHNAERSMKRLYESERTIAEINRLLLRAGDMLSSSVNLETVLQGLMDVVSQATHRGRVVVSLFDPERRQLHVKAVRGDAVFSAGDILPLDAFAPEVERSIDEKRALPIDYGVPDMPPHARDMARQMDSSVALSVPLVYRDRVIGQVRIDEPGSDESFSVRDIAIAESIASQAAASIENARLYESEQEHARLSACLNELDRDLHSSLDRRNMIRMAVEAGADAIAADGGAVALYRGDTAILEYACGFPEDVTGISSPLDVQKEGFAVLQSGRTVVFDDAAGDQRIDEKHLEPYGVAAAVAVPLVVGGNAMGALWYTFREPHRFAEAEVSFAERLGASLSLAIENARLFETEKRGALLSDSIARINQIIHATLDYDQILQRVAVESAAAIGADSTVLALTEGELWVVKYASNRGEDLIGKAFTVEDSPFIKFASDLKWPVAIDDAFNDSMTVRATQEGLGVRAVMMAPLVVRDEIIGGLFFDYRDVHRFTAEEIRYAAQLASAIGLAIENGRLYEAKREIADRLQSALLMLPEALTGIDFAQAYYSATEATMVGGDFFDIFELSPDHIGITIGDVAGKGLDAAVLTSLAKNTIRAHAVERGKTPAHILSLANEVLYRSTPAEAFITVFYGMLDCRDGRLVYANAGHPSAAVLRSDGSVGRLQPTGPLLGALATVEYEDGQVSMEYGEPLLLYTDGLTEARRGREYYGSDRLFAFLESIGEAPSAKDLLDRVVDEVMAFTHNELHDDLALLVMRRHQDDRAYPQQQKLHI